MGRAKGFTSEAMQPARGTMAVMQYCLPGQLDIDPSYQRSIDNPESQALIADIALNWHWGRAQVLAVSRRGGKLYVVDGQHRLAAARLRGDIPQLPCLIEEFSDIAEEAALFNDLNDKRRPVSAIDKFRAGIVAGDAECIAVGEAMNRVGLALAPHTNPTSWKAGQIANIGGIRAAWKTHGAAASELALTVLAAAFKGQVLIYAGTIYPGLVAVCAGRPGEGVIDDAALAALLAALAGKTQEEWRNAILHEMASAGVGRVVAATAVFRTAMARALAVPYLGAASVAVPGAAAGFGSGYDKREVGAAFCAQCDRLVSMAEAARCKSAWCKRRDVVQ